MKRMSKTFYLLGEINNESLGIIQEIRDYQEECLENEFEVLNDIKIIISSEGGDESIGYAIFDTLVAYNKFAPVTTHGYGQVCSIASLILQAGEERLLSPNCIFMIHNGSLELKNSINGNLLSKMALEFKLSNERYYSCLAKRGGIPLDKIRKWCDNEHFFSAEEAVRAKFADRIIKEI